MERYFILMIALTLVGITVKKKNRQETNSWSTRQEERKMIAAITACENSEDYTHILSPYTKFKTSPEIGYQKKIYEATANKNGIQKIRKKTWRQG